MPQKFVSRVVGMQVSWLGDWVGGGGFCRDQRARWSRYREAGEFSGRVNCACQGTSR